MACTTAPRTLAAGLALLALCAAAPARAGEFTVEIRHVELQDTGIRPKVGDAVTFVNHAEIAHNLYLTYEDGRMETLDTQPPHTTKRAVLKQGGRVLVRCWIHPIIRMELEVGER